VPSCGGQTAASCKHPRFLVLRIEIRKTFGIEIRGAARIPDCGVPRISVLLMQGSKTARKYVVKTLKLQNILSVFRQSFSPPET
jgi:hypothetical protein